MSCVRSKYTDYITPDFSIHLPIYLYAMIAVIHRNTWKCYGYALWVTYCKRSIICTTD